MLGLIPTNPTITTETADNGVLTKVCVDADTEKILQRQRMIAMIGSPVLFYAAYTMKAPMPARVMVGGMGVACFVAHFTAYKAMRPHMSKG